jgi:hypothetical protein
MLARGTHNLNMIWYDLCLSILCRLGDFVRVNIVFNRVWTSEVRASIADAAF